MAVAAKLIRNTQSHLEKRIAMSSTTHVNQTETDRWESVLNRDPSAVGTFVYAVKSTGIFCLPTCSSRRPNRSNVVFFDSVEDALLEGFRACKKCNPDSQHPSRIESAIDRACKLIEQSCDTVTLREIAIDVNMSPYHFHRAFKLSRGVTPKAYVDACLAKKCQSQMHLSFGDIDPLPKRSKDSTKMKPVQFIAEQCLLGWIVIAGSDTGVCSIELGSDRSELIDRLEARFVTTSLQSNSSLVQWSRTVMSYFEQPGIKLEVPLDIVGTEFQKKVWSVMRTIPFGTTWTYQQLAQQIGMPTGTRAVATACAANPVALVIPCHRVIRSDGTLSGFRWGVDRKRALLDYEKDFELGDLCVETD